MHSDRIQPFKFAPVGSRVYNGYWGNEYTVLEHTHHDDWRNDCVVIRWETGPSAGRVSEHSTWFDHKRDRIIAEATS